MNFPVHVCFLLNKTIDFWRVWYLFLTTLHLSGSYYQSPTLTMLGAWKDSDTDSVSILAKTFFPRRIYTVHKWWVSLRIGSPICQGFSLKHCQKLRRRNYSPPSITHSSSSETSARNLVHSHCSDPSLFLERTFQSSSETVLALEMSRIVSIEQAPFPSVLSSKPRGMGRGAGSQVDSSQRKTCPAELTQQTWAAQLVPGKSLHTPWSSMPGKSAFVTQGHGHARQLVLRWMPVVLGHSVSVRPPFWGLGRLETK